MKKQLIYFCSPLLCRCPRFLTFPVVCFWDKLFPFCLRFLKMSKNTIRKSPTDAVSRPEMVILPLSNAERPCQLSGITTWIQGGSVWTKEEIQEAWSLHDSLRAFAHHVCQWTFQTVSSGLRGKGDILLDTKSSWWQHGMFWLLSFTIIPVAQLLPIVLLRLGDNFYPAGTVPRCLA